MIGRSGGTRGERRRVGTRVKTRHGELNTQLSAKDQRKQRKGESQSQVKKRGNRVDYTADGICLKCKFDQICDVRTWTSKRLCVHAKWRRTRNNSQTAAVRAESQLNEQKKDSDIEIKLWAAPESVVKIAMNIVCDQRRRTAWERTKTDEQQEKRGEKKD